MPFGWDAASIVDTVINNPTPPPPTHRNAPLVIVFAAFRIHANLLSTQPGQNMSNSRRHREMPFLTDLSDLLCHRLPAPSSIHTYKRKYGWSTVRFIALLKRILQNSQIYISFHNIC
jgi:hypothetical protein